MARPAKQDPGVLALMNARERRDLIKFKNEMVSQRKDQGKGEKADERCHPERSAKKCNYAADQCPVSIVKKAEKSSTSKMPSIPIFRLEYDPEFRQRFQSESHTIFDEGFLTNHTFARRFEAAFAAWSGHGHCVSASSGTSALEMIFHALDIRGKEVIVPANTFIATAVAVKNAGGAPVVADIEPRWLALDPDSVRKKITERTAAIAVVHIGGRISDRISALQNLCREKKLSLVEDCAHAHGASLRGKAAGSFGIAGAFSFHMTKVMTTGEGGAVVCQDADFARILHSCRQFGVDSEDSLAHVRGGTNAKMTEMQALMGLLEIERVDQRIQKRRDLAARYQERLSGTCWTPYVPPALAFSPYYKQILASPLPWQEVREFLRLGGIQLTGGVYHVPLHRQPAISEVPQDYPVAERFSRFHICPPCYPELTLSEVDQVCDRLLEMAK
jgi:dTDP-4-amino-4,6-dideoxygalactose transaminase